MLSIAKSKTTVCVTTLFIGLGCLAALLSAARDKNIDEITGTVNYREKIGLPRDANLLVELVDALDGQVVVTYTRDLRSQRLPFPFRLDTAKVDASHRSIVRAVIQVRGKVWLS